MRTVPCKVLKFPKPFRKLDLTQMDVWEVWGNMMLIGPRAQVFNIADYLPTVEAA